MRRNIRPKEIKQIQLTDEDDVQYRAFYDGTSLQIEEVPPPPPPPPPTMQDKLEELAKAKKAKEEQEERDRQQAKEDYEEEYGEDDGETPYDSSTPPPKDDSAFRSRLSSVMSDNKFDRRVRNRLRGKIDSGRLSRVATGSENVFKQKSSRKNKEYNVILLVDNSGSMHNGSATGVPRFTHAANSALFLARSFDGLNISLQIMMFNHNIWTVKGFDEKSNYDELYKELNYVHSGAGCNHDYSAIHEAYNQFHGRDGANLLVVLSDGEPAECENHNGVVMNRKRDMKEPAPCFSGKEVSRIDANDVITTLVHANARTADTVGLGMQSRIKYIPDAVEVRDMTEMKKGLLKLLNKKIRRA